MTEEMIIGTAEKVFDGKVDFSEEAGVAHDNSAFASFVGYIPEPIEETVYGPKILQGKYNAIVQKFERRTGTWPSGDPLDQYSINLQICDTVDAKVDGDNMYVTRGFDVKNPKAMETMIKEIHNFVAPLVLDAQNEEDYAIELDEKIAKIVGEVVTIRVWPKTKKVCTDGNWNTVKATEEDVKDRLPMNSKGELYNVDKNGYLRHDFRFSTKVDLNADRITLD